MLHFAGFNMQQLGNNEALYACSWQSPCVMYILKAITVTHIIHHGHKLTLKQVTIVTLYKSLGFKTCVVDIQQTNDFNTGSQIK